MKQTKSAVPTHRGRAKGPTACTVCRLQTDRQHNIASGHADPQLISSTLPSTYLSFLCHELPVVKEASVAFSAKWMGRREASTLRLLHGPAGSYSFLTGKTCRGSKVVRALTCCICSVSGETGRLEACVPRTILLGYERDMSFLNSF